VSFVEVYVVGALAILGLMVTLWIISLLLKNSSIVDIFWGPGFVLTNAIYTILTPDGAAPRKMLTGILVSLWGLRLGAYILGRNWGKPEDFRYAKWRREAGTAWWWRSLFKVFLFQGLLMAVISGPLLAAQIGPKPSTLTVWDGIGVLVWVVGFCFETIGDLQMARFKADSANKGQVLDHGVWHYSRHPNYFGDSAQWWAFYLIAAVAGGAWAIYSPILMTGLLLRVSGVSLLEKTLVETKPAYRGYVESTSAFVPWFPRRQDRDGR
jgi:steroid 5-alpha reductase family enzyme